MSNVILGIIGVVLVIGSAIAGATFLGPAFFSSTADAEATSGMQTLSQISAAIHIRDAELGTATEAGYLLNALAPNYLPDPPENPFGVGGPVLLTETGSMSGTGQVVVMPVGGPNAEEVCNSVSRKGGGPSVAPSIYLTEINFLIGCFESKGNYGGIINVGDLAAYVRI